MKEIKIITVGESSTLTGVATQPRNLIATPFFLSFMKSKLPDEKLYTNPK